MLQQPMKEKLHAFKLQGMIESTGASGTGRSNAGVNLPRPSGAPRRSAVELA